MTKFKFKNILAVALLALTAVSSFAQVGLPINTKPVWSGTGTAVGTTLSYSVVSALSANNGTPVLTHIAADSDLAGSKILFYTVATNTTANYVSTSTSLPVVSTNGFVSADIIVIRHNADDTYERRILTTFTSSTNLTVTVAPTVALAIGDAVYREIAAGNIPWGAAYFTGYGGGTNAVVNPGGIYCGQPGLPLLFEINGTSLCHLSAATAQYLKPTP